MNTLKRIESQFQIQKTNLLEQHLWRELAPVLPSQCIDFSSNDYLGLAKGTPTAAPDLGAAVGVPFGAGASRLVFQNDDSLSQLESFCAQWLEWPSALYATSGFTANLAIWDALSYLSDTEFFLDVRAHASLHVGSRAAKIQPHFFAHKNYFQLKQKLEKSVAKNKIIFVESLHSMDGDYEDARSLLDVCKTFDCVLVVDEAHSAGIVGKMGRGWLSLVPELKDYALAVMFGCGKAFGVTGGIIACRKSISEAIVNVSKSFIYTTAVSPVVAQFVLKAARTLASDVGENLRIELKRNIEYAAQLKQKLSLKNMVCNEGSPILAYMSEHDDAALSLSKALVEKGFFVRAMRPPTVPRGAARVRIILHASHTKENIDSLFLALKDYEHALSK